MPVALCERRHRCGFLRFVEDLRHVSASRYLRDAVVTEDRCDRAGRASAPGSGVVSHRAKQRGPEAAAGDPVLLELAVPVVHPGGEGEVLPRAVDAQLLAELVVLVPPLDGDERRAGRVEVVDAVLLHVAVAGDRHEGQVVIQLVTHVESEGVGFEQRFVLGVVLRVARTARGGAADLREQHAGQEAAAVVRFVGVGRRRQHAGGQVVVGLEGAQLALVIEALDSEHRFEPIIRSEQHRQTEVLIVAVRGVATRRHVVHVAVVLLRGEEHLRREHVLNEGGVEHAAELPLAVLADGRFDPTAKLAGGPAADDVHHAADGVLPEQRALRATQHLDPLQVEVLEHLTRERAEVDAVDHHADG